MESSDKIQNLRIIDISEEDRPREKALKHGFQSLTTAELIAILLGSGSRGESVLNLSQRILASSDNSLTKLSKRSIKNLMTAFKGIGEAKAITLLSAIELGKRYRDENPIVNPTITSPEAAFNLIYDKLENKPQEYFYVTYLNNVKKALRTECISKGSITGTTVDIRLIIRQALEEVATAIILYHNHPSGTLMPSAQDDALTQRIVDAAALFDIAVVDHLIIGQGKFYSYMSMGRINPPKK